MREKVESILHELAAQYLARESNRQSLITVTRVAMLSRGQRAVVYVTILPDEQEDAALAFVNRKQNDFWLYLKKNARLKVIPQVSFVLDRGEKNRQNLDTLGNG